MAQIQVLPHTTKQLLGSTQVITSPYSVIKELVENALDAHATSIFVEISANALDVLQVRDNGLGIPPEDRQLVANRYCTSKIRRFEDIKSVGGSCLGFRGEALASMAAVSGAMSITTRTEGEEAAQALQISRDGSVQKTEYASHPIGTTVKVTNLYEALPVRKQYSLKTASKNLASIKTVMQKYALARPSIRYSLKVLKAKDIKSNWSYVPSATASPEGDVVLKVLGKDCASQCERVCFNSNGFQILAFLPRQDAIAKKICDMGQFISVDTRPMASKSGFMKDIVTLFKKKLKKCNPDLETVKDPLFCLNICCPVGSYDPNIEPAKDDVLFEDQMPLHSALSALLDQCYPEHPSSTTTNTSHTPFFEPATTCNSTWIDNIPSAANMYSGNDDDEIVVNDSSQIVTQLDSNDENDRQGLEDLAVSNPWTIAKMNAPARLRVPTVSFPTPHASPLREYSTSRLNSSSPTSQDRVPVLPPYPPWTLPTPANTSPLQEVHHDHDASAEHGGRSAPPRQSVTQDSPLQAPVPDINSSSRPGTPSRDWMTGLFASPAIESEQSECTPRSIYSLTNRDLRPHPPGHSSGPWRLQKPFLSPCKRKSESFVRHASRTRGLSGRSSQLRQRTKRTRDGSGESSYLINDNTLFHPAEKDYGKPVNANANNIPAQAFSPVLSTRSFHGPSEPKRLSPGSQASEDLFGHPPRRDVPHGGNIAHESHVLSISWDMLSHLANQLRESPVANYMNEFAPEPAYNRRTISKSYSQNDLLEDIYQEEGLDTAMETAFLHPPVHDGEIEDWRLRVLLFLAKRAGNLTAMDNETLEDAVNVNAGLLQLREDCVTACSQLTSGV